MDNKLNISALLAFVRKHQDYKPTKSSNFVASYQSISDWIEAEQIAKGQYMVKAYNLYRNYITWCEGKGIEKKQIAKTKTFHSTMREVLNYKLIKRALYYYLNKKVDYAPQKKDQAASSKKDQETKKD